MAAVVVFHFRLLLPALQYPRSLVLDEQFYALWPLVGALLGAVC